MGNAAIIERLVALWAEGRLDTAPEYFDPAIEWSEPPDTIGRHVVSGIDAALAALGNWSDQFDSLRVETTEMREEGDRVLHAMKQYARAGGSTVEIEGDLYMVWWLRDGKAVRMEMYNTREQAEEAFNR
ncbi:MAG TPA: nuclear transport factor 2 family protein [Thermoleophilaceae bacterium]|nr:nuclear transport factor 2 family protein [Thermoleophilaceae bacterium]